ncbi:hypothetical protein BST23_22345 [Mycolicibacterium elephantis]|uniref:Uncharacterized protein n=1 Tax=Mycolicibacterium elephantis TaxID=81858 RepID=A0A1X0CLT8_9MYCO|nr:hypothetical protein [Mycolicibacterium elephantis]ORA61084.1 hypothetical protein BST23_22345 [Mycolicibacterium elephantis]
MLLAESFIERNGTVFQILAAVLLAALTGLATWYLAHRNKATKTLDYCILSDLAIVSSDNRPDRLKIMLGTVEVNNPFVTLIRFKNTGKQVIEPDDYLDPIQICRREAAIRDWSIADESERNLADDIGLVMPVVGDNEFDEHVAIKPNTLNPGDWFDVQIIYDGSLQCRPEVTTRIKSQTRKMQEYQPKSLIDARRRTFALVAGAMLGLIGGFLSSMAIANDHSTALSVTSMMALLGTAVAMMIGGISAIRLERLRFWT